MDEIMKHWTESVDTHGASLEATTKARTAKLLELDVLTRRLEDVLGGPEAAANVLEVGCGNGVNCVELAERFPHLTIDGVDFIPEMVAVAESKASGGPHSGRLRFFVGEATAIGSVEGLAAIYDVVFTDRCLINLDSVSLQKKAISALARLVRPGGYLLMIENSAATHGDQNRYREALGLPPRNTAWFNLFFDETEILDHVRSIGLEIEEVEDFISLHDLVLYVLVPAVNGGEVDYGHPVVEAATKLSLALSKDRHSPFGALGQGRLYVCRRPA